MSILNKIIKKDEETPKDKPKVVKKSPKPRSADLKRTKSGEVPVHYFEIIKRPHISEKAFTINAQGQYVFLVADGANKTEIKKAIEKSYGVKVASVNTIMAKSKPKRYKGYENVRSGFKKAVITLSKGSTIDIMESAK